MSEYIKWFNEVGMDDVELVGGKNASLGEMYRHLTAEGIHVPKRSQSTERILSHSKSI